MNWPCEIIIILEQKDVKWLAWLRWFQYYMWKCSEQWTVWTWTKLIIIWVLPTVQKSLSPDAYLDALIRSRIGCVLIDDDYVLPHQRLRSFDVLVCPLSATERFLLQPLICGTVFHRTSLLLPSLSIFCCRLESHLFSLSYPTFCLFSRLYSAYAVTRHFGHYNRYYYI